MPTPLKPPRTTLTNHARRHLGHVRTLTADHTIAVLQRRGPDYTVRCVIIDPHTYHALAPTGPPATATAANVTPLRNYLSRYLRTVAATDQAPTPPEHLYIVHEGTVAAVAIGIRWALATTDLTEQDLITAPPIDLTERAQ